MRGCVHSRAEDSGSFSNPARGVTAHHGLPRKARLTTPGQFRRVFSGAVRSADQYFTILARAGDGERPRLGISVSKRVAKRAVDRNRIKRLIRERFRLRTDLPRWDFVVSAKPMSLRADNSVLRASLEQQLTELCSRRST